MSAQHHSAESMALPGFTISQASLGASLQFEPALQTPELDAMIDAYVPGSDSIQQKRAAVCVEFFSYAAQTGQTNDLQLFFPVFPTSFSTESPSSLGDSGYASGFNVSPALTNISWDASFPVTTPATPSSAFAAPSQHRVTKAKSAAAPSRKASAAATAHDFSHIPGMKILTKDGVDVTNSASRGSKTKAMREHAHLIRLLKACDSCKKKKVRCDPSHKRRAAAAVETVKSKKSKSASPPVTPQSDLVAQQPSFQVAPVETSPVEAGLEPFQEAFDWEKYMHVEDDMFSVPMDFDFNLDPQGFLTPSSGSSGSPSQSFTPISSAATAFEAAPWVAAGGIRDVEAAVQQPQLPYLHRDGHTADYVDFTLYSPASSFLDEEPQELRSAGPSPSSAIDSWPNDSAAAGHERILQQPQQRVLGDYSPVTTAVSGTGLGAIRSTRVSHTTNVLTTTSTTATTGHERIERQEQQQQSVHGAVSSVGSVARGVLEPVNSPHVPDRGPVDPGYSDATVVRGQKVSSGDLPATRVNLGDVNGIVSGRDARHNNAPQNEESAAPSGSLGDNTATVSATGKRQLRSPQQAVEDSAVNTYSALYPQKESRREPQSMIDRQPIIATHSSLDQQQSWSSSMSSDGAIVFCSLASDSRILRGATALTISSSTLASAFKNAPGQQQSAVAADNMPQSSARTTSTFKNSLRQQQSSTAADNVLSCQLSDNAPIHQQSPVAVGNVLLPLQLSSGVNHNVASQTNLGSLAVSRQSQKASKQSLPTILAPLVVVGLASAFAVHLHGLPQEKQSRDETLWETVFSILPIVALSLVATMLRHIRSSSPSSLSYSWLSQSSSVLGKQPTSHTVDEVELDGTLPASHRGLLDRIGDLRSATWCHVSRQLRQWTMTSRC